MGHTDALGKVLPDEAVGVLARAALPGVVRSREIDLRSGQLLEPLVPVELSAVVDGDGPHAMVRLANQRGCTAVECFGGTAVELPDHGVARLAADEREGAVTVEGTDDGIAFKVAHAGAVLGAGGALGY